MELLVSVVIPNYNYGCYLGEAIESVLGQSYQHREVLVVDDGSTDDSEAVARGYGDRVRWLQQDRHGVSAARNLGVQNSRGALIAFLDADDYWLPNKLERQVAQWMRDPAIGLIHCGARMIEETGRVLESRLDGLEGWLAEEMLRFERPSVLMAGSSALVPRATFESVGGFDVRLSTSADWDFCYRVAVHQRIGFVPEALICVRLHRTNMHWNIRLMERDMLLAYDKAFRDVTPERWRLRRQSYGNLHLVLGGSYLSVGQPLDAARHLLKSLWLAPGHAAGRLTGRLRP